MTRLTNKKLVEKLKFLIELGIPVRTPILESLLKEASAPIKEFAGMDKAHWENLSIFLNNTRHQELFSEESAACRMIAEGLAE